MGAINRYSLLTGNQLDTLNREVEGLGAEAMQLGAVDLATQGIKTGTKGADLVSVAQLKVEISALEHHEIAGKAAPSTSTPAVQIAQAAPAIRGLSPTSGMG